MNSLEPFDGATKQPELLLESLAFGELVTLVSRVTADILATLQELLSTAGTGQGEWKQDPHSEFTFGNASDNARVTQSRCGSWETNESTSDGGVTSLEETAAAEGSRVAVGRKPEGKYPCIATVSGAYTKPSRGVILQNANVVAANVVPERESLEIGLEKTCRRDTTAIEGASVPETRKSSNSCPRLSVNEGTGLSLKANGSSEASQMKAVTCSSGTCICRSGATVVKISSPTEKQEQLLVVQEIALEAAIGCLQLHRQILRKIDAYFGSSDLNTHQICWRKLNEKGEQFVISWDSPNRQVRTNCNLSTSAEEKTLAGKPRINPEAEPAVVGPPYLEVNDKTLIRRIADSPATTLGDSDWSEAAVCERDRQSIPRSVARGDGESKRSVASSAILTNNQWSVAVHDLEPPQRLEQQQFEDQMVEQSAFGCHLYRRSSISCRDLQEMRLLHQRGAVNSQRRRGTPSGRRAAGSRGSLMRGALSWRRLNGLVSTVCTAGAESAGESEAEREAKEKRLLCLALCLPFFTLDDIVSTVARLSVGCYNLAMVECPTVNLDLCAPGSEHLLLLPGFLEHVVPRARHSLRQARLSCVEHLALTGMMGKSLRELTLVDVPTVAGCSLLPSQLLLRCWSAEETSTREQAIAEVAQALAPLRSLTLWLYALCWRCPLLHSLTIHFHSTLPFSLACGSPVNPVEAAPASVFFKLLMNMSLVVRNAAASTRDTPTSRAAPLEIRANRRSASDEQWASIRDGKHPSRNDSLTLPIETLEIVGCSSVMPLALLLCIRMTRLRSLVLTTTSGLSTASLTEFLTLFRQYTLVRTPEATGVPTTTLSTRARSASDYYELADVACNPTGYLFRAANSVSSGCCSSDDSADEGAKWNKRSGGTWSRKAAQWVVPKGLYDEEDNTNDLIRGTASRLQSISIHHGSNIGVAQLIDALVAFPNLRNLRITSNNSFGSDVIICHLRLEMLEISAHSCLTWDLHLPALRRLQLVVSSSRKEANDWLEPGRLRKWLQQRLLPRSPKLKNFSLRQTNTSFSSLEFNSRKALWNFCYGPFAGNGEQIEEEGR